MVWAVESDGGYVRLETSRPLPESLWKLLKSYVEILKPAEIKEVAHEEAT